MILAVTMGKVLKIRIHLGQISIKPAEALNTKICIALNSHVRRPTQLKI